MIKYALKCAAMHEFESWFQSASAFDALLGSGHVACPICGEATVEKLLMAPAVRPGRKTSAPEGKPNLKDPATEVEAAMSAMRAQIEANSDYVGMNFVSEARKMHAGNAPERSIYGEAKPEEAKKLIEDGIPVAPLPFLPKRKAN